MPLAAPDEAVLLKNSHDLHRDLILVCNRVRGRSLCPAPIVRMLQRDIDGNAKTVRRHTFRAGNGAAIICTGRWKEIRVEGRRQGVEFLRYGCEAISGAVGLGHFQFLPDASGIQIFEDQENEYRFGRKLLQNA